MSRHPAPRLVIEADLSASALEAAARRAHESGAGRCLSDAEWAEARSRLLDFAVILRGWDRKAKNPQPELGNVDAICQREP